MTTRVALVCVTMCLLPQLAFGQAEQQPPTTTPAPLTRSDFEQLAMKLQASMEQIASRQDSIEKRIATLEDHEKQIKELRERVDTLSDGYIASRQAIDQIARQDKDGKYYPRLDAQHEPMRKELENAIAEVSPTTGIIELHNKTNVTRAVAVNGTTYDVLAQSKREVSVPYRHFEVRTCNGRTYASTFNYPNPRRIVNIEYITSTGTTTVR